MKVRAALKRNYHSGLEMLRQCVTKCPQDLWVAPDPQLTLSPHPDNPRWNGVERGFWRVAFHSVYFTHLYLGQNEEVLVKPPADFEVRRTDFEGMWSAPWDLEPYELPNGTTPCSLPGILEYLNFVDGLVDTTVEGLDLDHESSGFRWYKNETKIEHEMLNLRHLQGHVGQLSELLMLRGIDIEWV